MLDRSIEDDTSASFDFLAECYKIGTDIRVYNAFGIEPEEFRDGKLAGLIAMERAFFQ